MGYVQSKPIAVGGGTITLRYLGGTVCHKGKSTESRRSTRINFFCSNKEVSPMNCINGVSVILCTIVKYTALEFCSCSSVYMN